ncbi:cell division protein FtsA [Actinobacillus pleuropneumoniae]|nr:cell division protein FtsA [Actinobacillus pleuropneumoniae]
MPRTFTKAQVATVTSQCYSDLLKVVETNWYNYVMNCYKKA